jgi:hypothetical protein
MLTLFHYLPYVLVVGLLAFIIIMFSSDNDRKTDYRRLPRERHYQWNDHSAHRD